MNKIRLLIVDDQPIIREGLKSLLTLSEDIDVVGEANHGEEALTKIAEWQPHVVLMDIRMPVMDGVEATKRIKEQFPQTIVIILTTFDDDHYIIDALNHGASGYLLKDINAHQLINAIRDGFNGNILLPGKVATKLTGYLMAKKQSSSVSSDFTQREQAIIQLLIKGYSNTEIADELFLSVGTVKNYLSQIYSKASVSDRSNAILYFKNLGF